MRVVALILLASTLLALAGCGKDTVTTQDVDEWQKPKGPTPAPVDEGRDR